MSAPAPVFSKTDFLDLYEKELATAFPKNLQPEGIQQQRKNCIVGSVAFGILALIAAAGAAYVIATTGGPAVNPAFFYSAVGVAGVAAVLSVAVAVVLVRRLSRARSAHHEGMQQFTAEPITRKEILEKLAAADQELFDQVLKRLTPAQLTHLLESMDEELAKILDKLANHFNLLKERPPNIYTDELAIALLETFDCQEVWEERDNHAFLLKRLNQVPRDEEHSTLLERYALPLAYLAARRPAFYAEVVSRFSDRASVTFYTELTKLTKELNTEQDRQRLVEIRSKLFHPMIEKLKPRVHSLESENVSEISTVLDLLESIGLYATEVIRLIDTSDYSLLKAAVRGRPHLAMLLRQLLVESNDENYATSVEREHLMTWLWKFRLVRKAWAGDKTLPDRQDPLWDNFKAIVAKHDQSIPEWPHTK